MMDYIEPPALIITYSMNSIEKNQDNQNKKLHELVKDAKNLDQLKLLLQQPRIDIDSIDDGSTALYKAAEHGNAEAVELLLQHSANVNSYSSYTKWNVLIEAVMRNHLEVVKKLLAHPAIDVNAQDNFQYTALHFAVNRGCFECVKLLLNHPDININIKDSSGFTPLGKAAFLGNAEIVRILLSRPDIEVNFVDVFRDTPLHQAVARGHIEVVQLLLNHPSTNVDIINRPFNSTVYDLAVTFGEVEILKLLEEKRKSNSFGDVLSPGDNYQERKPEPRKRRILIPFDRVIRPWRRPRS